MKARIELHVNGQLQPVEVDPDTPLLYVLRNQLGLKGAKYACGLEQCGACNVLIDGEAVPSCKLPVGSLGGSEIVTIEGLGTPETLHPVQEAFIDQQATQCGYCTAGLVIAAQGLLNKVRYPTEEQINDALDGHLCRCGTQERVRRAIKLRIARPYPDDLVATRELNDLSIGSHTLPMVLEDFPDLGSWIQINEDETVTVFSGKVEYGQGIQTALAQVAAEELDVALDRIRMVMGDTARTPNEGMTVGSNSMMGSGNAIRQAAAEARRVLLNLALEELEALPDDLEVEDGQITDRKSGRLTSYWELQAGKPFHHQIRGTAQPKMPERYQVVGSPAARLDLVSKVTGTLPYVQDLHIDGMAHGRVVRPPTYHTRLKSIDLSEAEAMPGVLKVVRDGSFLGVIAEEEFQAVQAMEKLSELAVWEFEPIASQQENLYDETEAQIDEHYLVVDGTATFDPIPDPQPVTGAVKTISAEYRKPYHMHATIGPSSALAVMREGKLTIWTHSQGVFPPRDRIAAVLKMEAEDLHLMHVEGSGTYGHNGAEDASLDAALLARALPGKPVLLKWTRANEHQWEPYSPPALIKMNGSLDAQGRVVGWNHEVYSAPHLGRGSDDPGTSSQVAAWHLAEPLVKPPMYAGLWNNGCSHRNADPLYHFGNKRIVKHVQLKPALRVSSFRGLGAYANVFALESFVDEMAHAAGTDPVEFRLKHLEDPRAVAVIEAAAEGSDWGSKLPEDHGRGFAFSQYVNHKAYCAVSLVVRVDRGTGEIMLLSALIAAEAGQVVNPDGLSNQLEGGLIQAASMTLKEQVDYGPEGIRSVDWETYPILTFSETPRINSVILNRPGAPFLGSGEASIGPTPAAIANAVFDAAGVRLREIPFVPSRFRKAFEAG